MEMINKYNIYISYIKVVQNINLLMDFAFMIQNKSKTYIKK